VYTTDPTRLRHVFGTVGTHPRFPLLCRRIVLPLSPPTRASPFRSDACPGAGPKPHLIRCFMQPPSGALARSLQTSARRRPALPVFR
jgi:hypothetical protein